MVHEFAAEGANVVIAARKEAEGIRLAESIGEKAIFVQLDVTSEASWLNAFTKVESHMSERNNNKVS
jgi:3alpha(or 20beta)-hydroxysteroid dehydrogenase